jgi:nanoRNase/pAp phosphatase (c-di-AMP/oligoRNAs hydrolase)
MKKGNAEISLAGSVKGVFRNSIGARINSEPLRSTLHTNQSNGLSLLRFLQEHRRRLSPMLILTHDYPDPDALAAAFSLQYLAGVGFGVETCIGYRGQVGRMENKTMVRLLRIPMHKFKPAMLTRYASIALVDTQPAFENNPFPDAGKAALVLDQHPSVVVPHADLAIVDPDCGATCVLIAQALLEIGLPLTSRIATALSYGILSDTLDLYRVRRQDTVDTYLKILHHADMRLLARIQNPVRPRKFFGCLAKGILEARLYRRLVVTHLGEVDTPDRVAQVAEFLLVYNRIRWCLVTGRYKGRLHASFRSTQPRVQAGEILRDVFENRHEAGGHGAIAGGACRVGASERAEIWRTTEERLTARLVKRLRIPNKAQPRRAFGV